MSNKLSTKKIVLITVLSILAAFFVAVFGIFIYESVRAGQGNSNYNGEVPDYQWSESDEFDIAQYPVITTDDGNVKVMQLTDLHYLNSGTFAGKFGVNYILDNSMKSQVRGLVSTNEPDLLVITGDLITYKNAVRAYEELAEFFDSLDVPWTLTFGNHYAEYNAGKAKLSEILMAAENCIYQPGPTNLVGLGHHIVRINDKNGKLSQALIMADSNDYVKNSEWDKGFDFSTETAGFYAPQVAWYEWAVKGLDAQYKQDNPVGAKQMMQTSFYCHVNFECPPDTEADEPEELNRDGMRDKIVELNSTRFVFFGHTHSAGRTFTSPTENNLVLVNGVQGGKQYHGSDMSGATISDLKINGDTIIRHVDRRGKKETVEESLIPQFM